MQTTHKDKNLSAFDTQGAISSLLTNGNPRGEGFGFFQQEGTNTVNNYTAASLTPEKRSINGILIVDTPFRGSDNTLNQNSFLTTTTVKTRLQSGINAIQDDVQ